MIFEPELTNKDLHIIIPFKQVDKYREDNLITVIDHLLNYGLRPAQIIVIEGVSSGSQPLSLNFDNRVSHLIYPEDMDTFNKCKLYNYAVSTLPNNVLIAFHDSDLIIDLDALEACVRIVEQDTAKVAQPYNEETFLEELENGVLAGRTDLSVCGGITIMKKSFLQMIGGWNEDFENWGAEDNTLEYIINKFKFKNVRINGDCKHLYHPSFVRDITKNNKNEQLFTKILSMTNSELLTFVKEMRAKYKNKYNYE